MKRLLRHSFLALATAWLATACNEHTVYHSFQTISSKGWGKSDTLFFQVSVNDSLHPYRLTTEVRNLNNYAYKDLYLFVSHNFADSTVWKTDTIAFVLADEEGRWQGNGTGYLYQSGVPFCTVQPAHPGNYTIKVSQGMKDETLTGIHDVGVRVEK